MRERERRGRERERELQTKCGPQASGAALSSPLSLPSLSHTPCHSATLIEAFGLISSCSGSQPAAISKPCRSTYTAQMLTPEVGSNLLFFFLGAHGVLSVFSSESLWLKRGKLPPLSTNPENDAVTL